MKSTAYVVRVKRRLSDALRRHWFLACLAILFLLGFLAAPWLRPITRLAGLRVGIVFVVMLCAGITLPLSAVRRAMQRPSAVVWAIGLSILGVPLVGAPVAYWIAPEWFAGLMIAALMPCTLASAAVWTRKAGGDDSIALITTVVTNLACLAVIPAGLLSLERFGRAFSAAMMSRGEISIDAPDQVAKLLFLVIIPLLLAQALRAYGASAWAERHKIQLGVTAQIGILMMVMFGAVASADRWTINETHDGSAAVFVWSAIRLIIAASAVHLAVLWWGVAVMRRGGRDRATQIAVGISGSQKTLMIGLQTAIDCGVSVLPMIVYHIGQLVWDTLIVERWAARSKKETSTDMIEGHADF